MLKDIYQFYAETISGEQLSLNHFKGKVLLIVNTATECGFTPQLKDLATLSEYFKGKDFEILAFPSNDFGGQEPREGAEILNFCQSNFEVNYYIFNKTRVRGTYAHPLFQFLSDKKKNGAMQSTPRWNFHKYLIDKQGRVTDFFFPFTKPTSSKIKKRIERLLAAPSAQ
jgi:glutathione peroxidase